MSDRVLAQSQALRLILASLEELHAPDQATDAITRILAEADGCHDSLIEIILVLSGMLAQKVDASRNRADWVAYFELQLLRLLDQLGVES